MIFTVVWLGNEVPECFLTSRNLPKTLESHMEKFENFIFFRISDSQIGFEAGPCQGLAREPGGWLGAGPAWQESHGAGWGLSEFGYGFL